MIHYASVLGLFRTILILVLIYFGFKIIVRLLAPFLIKFVAKKAEQRFGRQYGQSQRQKNEPVKKEGEVSIDKVPNIKNSNKDLGEYIDYEEVK